MREILFRGKRIDNGEWVVGIPWIFSPPVNKAVIVYAMGLVGEDDDTSRYCECHEVDPSTIGQYTGLTDKNGKKIFENDIVLCAEPLGMAYREIRGKVVYKLTGFVVDCGGFNTTLSGGLCQTPYYVIGNIHDDFELFDNPELLEGKS